MKRHTRPGPQAPVQRRHHVKVVGMLYIDGSSVRLTPGDDITDMVDVGALIVRSVEQDPFDLGVIKVEAVIHDAKPQRTEVTP